MRVKFHHLSPPNTKGIALLFRNSVGFGFFVPIFPQFETDRGKDGKLLGIHPDGNGDGTEGCIGLDFTSNTNSFYNAIGSTAPGAEITLKVE